MHRKKYMFFAFPQIAECCPKLLSLDLYIHFPTSAAQQDHMERALTLDISWASERAVSSNNAPHGLQLFTFRELYWLNYIGHQPNLDSAKIVARYLAVVFPQLKYVDFSAIASVVGKA